MAQKRMFSLNVVDTDNFLEMPISSRLLYYELGMRADDDGFVDNWKKILLFTGLKEDDMKLLITKQFIIPFKSGVIVIKHWRLNNYLQKDRTKPTIYQEELKQLGLDENNVYILDTTCIHSIDKYSIEKNSIDKYSNIYEYIENNFGRTLSPIEYEEIEQWEDNDLTRYAIKQAILNGAYSIKYISKILFNYEKAGIKTVQQAQEKEKKFNSKKNKIIEETPDWFNQEIKNEPMTEEEKKEMDDLLKSLQEDIKNIGDKK